MSRYLTRIPIHSSLRSRIIPGLLISLAVGLLLTIIILLLPKKYNSEAKLFIQLGRGSIGLDPTATTNEHLSIYETRETEVNSLVSLLEGRGIAEQVVDAMGTDYITYTDPGLITGVQSMIGTIADKVGALIDSESTSNQEGQVDLKARDRAIRRFMKSLDAESVRDSATVDIEYAAGSSEHAQRILDKTIEIYLANHVAAHQTPGSLEFFRQQVARQQKLVDAISEKLRNIKNEYALYNIESRQQGLNQQLVTVESRLTLSQSALEGEKTRLTQIKKELQTVIPVREMERTTNANQGKNLMRSELYRLETEFSDIRGRYKPSHQKYRLAEERLKEAQATHKKESGDHMEIKTAVNPVHQSLQQQLVTAKINHRVNETEVHSLTKKRDQLLDRIKTLNDQEISFRDLSRKLKLAATDLETYETKLAEAEINESLDAAKVSSVRIVQPPTLNFKHVFPKRLLMLLVAGFLSVVSGVIYVSAPLTRSGPSDNVIVEDEKSPIETHDVNQPIQDKLETPFHSEEEIPSHVIAQEQTDTVSPRPTASPEPIGAQNG